MDLAVTIALVGDVILLLTMAVFAYQAREMAHQGRETAAATRAAVYQGIADQMLAIDRLFVERPELRPFLYDSRPVPSDSTARAQVMALAEMFVDLFDNFVTQSGNIPEELFMPWRQYAQALMRTSPALCEFWAENKEWYSHLLRSVIEGPLGSVGVGVQDAVVRMESATAWEAPNAAQA